MINKIRILILAILAMVSQSVASQIHTPVKWTSELKFVNDNEAVVNMTATIDDGWHVYGLDIPKGGPVATSASWNLKGAELDGALVAATPVHEEIDMVFHLKLSWWEKKFVLTQKVRITDKDAYDIGCVVEYMVCNSKKRTCLPPQKEQFNFVGNGESVPQATDSEDVQSNAISALKPAKEKIDTWAAIDFDDGADNKTVSTLPVANRSLWYILIVGFIGGLIAMLTPCIWSMIPLTVSFFLKKSASHTRYFVDALIYGISIIVIYLLLGLLITAVFGAGALNALSTNAIFNIAFFALLVIFAISFFGAFDIKLPDSWANSMDSRAERTTGIISIFFMAFTLVLVSFSCTGPIIGTLLVEAADSRSLVGPAVGMFGFALGLAIPFVLFAIFPSGLKKMPKAGGWLNSVKVVLGFIELALSLKFLSVADLAYGWGILDRETFLTLWIVIFALLGVYLLGKLRFSHDSKIETIGVTRFFLALFSFAFALYLLPGLWGAPLKSVSAFVPPLSTQDFNLYEHDRFMEFDDYDEGMAYARDNGKPVLLAFSGYGCVNCRKMEAAVFDAAEVSRVIKKDFVFIHLMVDDRSPLSKKEKVTEAGKQITLSTVGEKWSYLQRHKFAANSQPYYVVLDGKGKLLSGPYYYDENIDNFISFLHKGLQNDK